MWLGVKRKLPKPIWVFLQNLHKQLEEAIQDGEIWVMQLKDTEYELEGSRERVQQQATEILHKASKTRFFALVFAAFGTRSAQSHESSIKHKIMSHPGTSLRLW